MQIIYEITDSENGDVIGTITGTELRTHFGIGPMSPVFNEELVRKFNTHKEFSGEPERLRQTITGVA